jgi:hypothetical protein
MFQNMPNEIQQIQKQSKKNSKTSEKQVNPKKWNALTGLIWYSTSILGS